MSRFALSISIAALLAATPAAATDIEALKAEAKQNVVRFASELKAKLQQAIKHGGPVNGIEVCSIEAPGIAESVSAASGWSVARSSHKLRNPANAPDDYTARAIAEFLQRQQSGEKAETMVKAQIVEENGARVFHFVKAIPTGELCLTCHGGDEVAPEVVSAIEERYPDDAARGFRVGEMRGVFTLKKRLD